jgi:sugar/nucleoside kinase (ribokinase family)
MTPEDVSVDGEVDAVCIGETMVAFVGTADSEMYLATTAGSASNVAVGLARLGLRTRWVSRIGDDPLGRFVEETLAGSGVDLAVVRLQLPSQPLAERLNRS